MPILFRSDENDDAGLEPWVTDGTAIGTGLLRDTSFGGTLDAGGFDIAYTVEIGVVFRVSNDDYDGLWWTNGQASQTNLLLDSFGTRLYRQGTIEFNGDFIVQGSEVTSGRGVQEFLLRVGRDGTQTVLVELEGSADSLIHLGSHFLYEDNGTLWGSNGTAAGTVALPNFLSDTNAGFGRVLQVRTETANGQNVLIEARADEDIVNLNGADRVQGQSLWISDGTSSGTVRLDAIGSISGIDTDIATDGDNSFVRVEATELSVDPDFPNVIVTDREDQLWQVNLATETTSLIASLGSLYTGDPALPNPQTFGTGMSEPILNGNEIGFVAFATDRFRDGVVSRAVPFAEFYQVPFGVQATAADAVRLEHVPENFEFFIFNDQLVYTVVEGSMRQYYAADTDTGTATLILETSSVRSMYPVTEPFLVGDNVVFATVQYVFSNALVELYSWDGTSNPAELIGEFRGPSPTSSLADLSIETVIRQDGDLLYFVDRASGLYVSDGTVAGTELLVNDTSARILGSGPIDFRLAA